MSYYPCPDQGETSGDPQDLECPHCGKHQGLDEADGFSRGEKITCGFCDKTYVIIDVDYSVTLYVRAVDPKKEAVEREKQP